MKRIALIILLVSTCQLFAVTPAPSCPTFGKVFEFNQTRHGSFDDAVKEGHIVVVDFYGTGCPPCKKLSPIIEQLAKELPDIKFMKVNTATNNALANKYGIRSIPQLFFFKGGQLQRNKSLRGFQTKGAIKKQITSLR